MISKVFLTVILALSIAVSANALASQTSLEATFSSNSDSLCGDVDNNGEVNILDLTSLYGYLYRGSPAPPGLSNADMDGCTGVNVRDLKFIIARLLQGGWPPCTGPVDCVPGSDQGSPDSVKLVFSLLPENGSNVPIVVDCSVWVDIDPLETLQFGWQWDNPDVQIDSVVSSAPFDNFDFATNFFLDTSNATTNDSQIAICSGIALAGNPEFDSDSLGWRHIASYYMTASNWTDSSNLTIDTIQHPDYASTEYIFIPSGNQYYQPFWGGSIDTVCCVGARGDLNGDGDDASILDLTFLVDFIFRGSGDPGICPDERDVNGDGNSANILDLTYIVDLIFRGGPVPPACPQ